MAQWHLSESYQTTAGTVAAGSAGTGPALVLAHGWPWSSYAWHRIIPALTQRFTVYWYDMPGYGRSDKDPTQRTSLDVQGNVFGEMLDHWQLDAPTVIAHDFGGAATLRAHLLQGRTFAAYVLMNVVALRPWGSDFFDHVGKHIDAFSGLPPHIHKALVTAYIAGAITTPLRPADLSALIAPWLTPEGAVSFYRQFAQADEAYTAAFEGQLDQIRCPVHVIWGKDDPWIPVTRGKALQAKIGTASLTLLNGVGHLPQLEAPEAVLAALHDLIQPSTRPTQKHP